MRAHFQAELKKARDLDVYRQLKKQVNVSPAEAIIDGKRATLFAGNDYLGLSAHPEVIKASVEATLTDGASATASRLITGNHKAYGLLEAIERRIFFVDPGRCREKSCIRPGFNSIAKRASRGDGFEGKRVDIEAAVFLHYQRCDNRLSDAGVGADDHKRRQFTQEDRAPFQLR